MYRFGPSGIPLSCKGRTLKDGIEDVHSLGLTAMEVQLVRLNISERYTTDEEVGLTPLQIEEELPVEIVRKEGDKLISINNLKTKLKKGDMLRILNSGFVRDYKELAELGKVAKEVDVKLSLHTPYYMDLAGQDNMADRSMQASKWSALIADQMNAEIVVTHTGIYGSIPKEETINLMTDRLRELNDWRIKNEIFPSFGVETSGRQEVFGSLDEIIEICRRIPGILPVLNFAHIHARENGSLKKKEFFQRIFDRTAEFCKGDFYTHFSGVEYSLGNEKRYTPIKKGDLKFELLAECVLENEFSVTFISSSPLLEHDAMYMRVILERVLSKKEAKKKMKPKIIIQRKPVRVEKPKPKPKSMQAPRPIQVKKKPVSKAKPKPKPKPARPAKKKPIKTRPVAKSGAKKRKK